MAGSIDCLKPIFPKYDYIKTDKSQEMCATYLNSKNRFNRIPGMGRRKVGNQVPRMISGKLTTKDIDWKGKARPLFYHYTTGEPSVLCCGTTDECDEPPPVICRGRTRTRCTQTHYRESSAQTRPYQPPIAGDKENYQNYEIYQISKLLDGYEFPGEYEAKVVERARRRRQYQRALLLVANDKEKHDTILEAMEWEDWVAREEDIQGCQMLRMEIVERMFKEREENFIKQSEKRIQMNSQKIHAKRSAQLKKINVEYARGVRRLEAAKQKISRKYRKGNIVDDHINPASDLHAPQMRFGVNPNRRHFVGFRKSFDERIEDLDKKKDERGVLASLTCPFSKLRTWAKPKEQIREVSQRFLSDENLKNMYDSLKRLRTIAEAPKPIPKCLKKKVIPVQEEEEEDLSPKDDFRLLAARKSCDEYQTEIENEDVIYDDDEILEEIPITAQTLTETLTQRRQTELANKYKTEIAHILGEYEGTAIGKLLQFLTYEAERLRQHKKFHAIQMLAERERYKREAREAGRRQKENKLRDDHERLFEAAGEVHKDTASMFLRSILEDEFDFSAEEMATTHIIAMAKHIDKQKEPKKNKRARYHEIVYDCVQHQVFDLAKKRLDKANQDKMNEAEARAIEEELFAGVNMALNENYQTPDAVEAVAEVLSEEIEKTVIYDFDIISPEESDDEEFDTRREIDEIIEKLVKMAVRYPGSSSIKFLDDSDYVIRLQAEKEVAAILRKFVKIAVPEERWKTHTDRIVEQCLSDTFNAAFYEMECLKAARVVRCDDRLQEALNKIDERVKKHQDESTIEPTTESSTSSSEFVCIRSTRSTIDLFDPMSIVSECIERTEDFKVNVYHYVDPQEIKKQTRSTSDISGLYDITKAIKAKASKPKSYSSILYGPSSSSTLESDPPPSLESTTYSGNLAPGVSRAGIESAKSTSAIAEKRYRKEREKEMRQSE